MKISEFLINFSKQYSVQHIDDTKEGTPINEINKDI